MYQRFSRAKLNQVKKAAGVLAAAVVLSGAAGIGVVSAQQAGGGTGTPTTPTAPNSPANRVNPGLVLVCSTTNYTDVAATALGLTSPALRLDLVSGKSLSDIATSKSVALSTVQTALKTAYEADLAQAVSSGLLTQAQADQITTRLNQMPAAGATANAAATPAATQPAPGGNGPANGPGNNNGRPPFGPGGRIGPQAGLGFVRIADRNPVNTFIVAAQAIGVSCPDLVKAVEGGQSMAQVATSKNVTAQTVIDALSTAQKAAVAQDVSEGLITQAQADKQTANITTRITQLVNHAGRLLPNGQGPFGPGGPGTGRRGGFGPGNGQPPAGPQPNGNGPVNGNGPNPAATPAVGTSS